MGVWLSPQVFGCENLSFGVKAFDRFELMFCFWNLKKHLDDLPVEIRPASSNTF